jgi:hypothetical protein
MQVTKINNFTLTCKPENTADYLARGAKKARKPALVTGKRVYPRYGAQCSTATYVREYYLANAAVYVATDGKGKLYDEIDDFFKPMTTHVSVPQGEDTMEIEA